MVIARSKRRGQQGVTTTTDLAASGGTPSVNNTLRVTHSHALALGTRPREAAGHARTRYRNRMGNAASSQQFCATAHERARALKDYEQHKRMASLGASSPRAHQVNFTNMSDIKPSRDVSQNKTLRPIWCSQMVTGTTHVGCLLSGTVIRAGIFTGGIYFLLEDAVGGLVKAGVYNIPNASPAVAMHSFPEGRTVAIAEPYLKVGSDGFPFIRIEQPDDLQLDACLPNSPDAWQCEGKRFFNAGKYPEAIECWDRSLALNSTTVATAVLFSNRAAALLQCSSRAAEAVRDSAIALVLDAQPKAAGRLVTGMVAIGLIDAAKQIAATFARRWPQIKPTLEKSFNDPQEKPNWDGAGNAIDSLFWEDASIISLLAVTTTTADIGCNVDATWESHKARGNSLFRSGAFREAVDMYSLALRLVDATPLVKLLTNKAAAFTHLEQYSNALSHAVAALTLDPKDVKSWHRRASALLKLGRHEAALVACEYGHALAAASGIDKPFETLKKSIAASTRACEALSKSGGPKMSTAEQKKQLEEMHSQTAKTDVMGAGQLAMMNALMIDALSVKMQIKLFGCKVPPMPMFHIEFPKHCGWPMGVDANWAKEVSSIGSLTQLVSTSIHVACT